MLMDIDSPHGTQVKFINKNGTEEQRRRARRFLSEGEIHTVEFVEIGGFESSVKLLGIEGQTFNTVMFEKVEVTTMQIKVIEEQNKVVLTQEVATAIEGILKKWEKRAVLQLNNYDRAFHAETIIIKKYFGLPADEHGFEKLTRALYIGYEVEQTVEEQLLEAYTTPLDHFGSYENVGESFQSGMFKTLHIIGMKVKGINA